MLLRMLQQNQVTWKRLQVANESRMGDHVLDGATCRECRKPNMLAASLGVFWTEGRCVASRTVGPVDMAASPGKYRYKLV